MNRPAEPSAKKPYQAPKLLVYGNLSEMTQAKGNMKMLDGGVVLGMRRTGG
jgi:hypothetical protein